MKYFKAFPSSLIALLLPNLVAMSILYATVAMEVPLNFVTFYLDIFFTIIVVIGIVGLPAIVEEFGWDVNGRYYLYLIYITIGGAFGYLIHKLSGIFSGMGIYPFAIDTVLSLNAIEMPLFFSGFQFFIVSLFEEMLSVFNCMTASNWLSERFKLDFDASILGGALIGRALFISLHIFSWGIIGANILSYIVGLFVSMFFTLFGWVMYSKEIWGKARFTEFSIIPGFVAHFVFDFLQDAQMKVAPPLLAATLLGV